MVTRTLKLNDDANAVLEAQAKATGQSVDDVLNGLLRRFDERVQLIAEGRADVAAGRTVDNNAMKAWVESWGSDDEKEPPACP